MDFLSQGGQLRRDNVFWAVLRQKRYCLLHGGCILESGTQGPHVSNFIPALQLPHSLPQMPAEAVQARQGGQIIAVEQLRVVKVCQIDLGQVLEEGT